MFWSLVRLQSMFWSIDHCSTNLRSVIPSLFRSVIRSLIWSLIWSTFRSTFQSTFRSNFLSLIQATYRSLFPSRRAPTRREPSVYRPKRHEAVDARLDNCPSLRCLACLKSRASCSTLLATESSWPRVLVSALTHWSIAIGSLRPDASSGR